MALYTVQHNSKHPTSVCLLADKLVNMKSQGNKLSHAYILLLC